MPVYTYKHGDRPLTGITIQRAVGRGGFGEVYYALSDAGKQLAVKYLRDNPDIELRGINIVMNLKSPHLITIYDVRQNDDGEVFVVMEYVSGPSLRDVMMAEPDGLPPEKAVFFINGIAQGLSYLHERGIVHRDLKPGNIFYDDGYVLIGDYGLSKHISVSAHSGQTVSVGTVHYMAPEIGSGNYSKAIDVYSLGVMLYEMLTGRLPFTGKSMAEILMRHLNDDPDTSILPRGFAPIVAKAMAKDPNERYQDVNEMTDALAELADVGTRLTQFDPSVIGDITRDATVGDEDPTRTSPGRLPPIPDLDARPAERAWEARIRNAGEQVARVAESVGQAGIGDKIRRKADAKAEKLARKLEAKAAKLEQKLGKVYGRRGRGRVVGAGRGPGAAEKPRIKRAPQLLVVIIVAIAVSIALTVLSGGREELGVGLTFLMMGCVFGPLLAHLRLLRHLQTRHWFLDRVVYASTAAVFSLIGFAALSDAGMYGHSDDGVALGAAVCLTILICDWAKRIEAGRRGKVRGGDAVMPAVVALVAASMLDADDYVMVAAATAATVSMLTQATAAMWPHSDALKPRNETAIKPPPAIAPVRVEPRDEVAVAKVPPPPEPVKAKTVAPNTVQTIEPARPSFAGRASGGGSFFGKLFMVAGLAGALLYHALQDPTVRTIGPWKADPLRESLGAFPEFSYTVLLGLGCLLVIMARRQCSGLHLIRGCVGCVLALWTAAMALGPAGEVVSLLLATGDTGVLRHASAYGPLAATAIPLLAALVLISWPDGRRDQVVI